MFVVLLSSQIFNTGAAIPQMAVCELTRAGKIAEF
jgi:hypothetical protein